MGYAMKILKKKAIMQRNQVEHTQAERKILEALHHPFLMTLRYAFQTETKLYFVLDYYTGGELFFHLKKRRRFREPEARLMVAEVGMALGYLHSLDVIYRDLKPENILLDHTGHICLTDFGLSKDLGPDNEDAHTFCGTPEYLAPEIVMNLGHGKAVDWWAVGILCYELTVGIPPFYSQNVNEMYRKIQEAPLLFPHYWNVIQKKRMGSSDLDVKEIERHAFFKNLDFNKLYKKEIEAPYKPNVKGLDDTSNFDEMFLKEAVVDSYAPKVKDDGFNDFTFAPKKGAL